MTGVTNATDELHDEFHDASSLTDNDNNVKNTNECEIIPSTITTTAAAVSETDTTPDEETEDDTFYDTKSETKTRGMADLPPLSNWSHKPVLLCADTAGFPTGVPVYGTGPCPIGTPFEFESDLFVGTILVRLRDVLPSDDTAGDDSAAYFKGRKRRFQAIVQGKFKQEIPVSDVLTGHTFVRPFKKLPPDWIINSGISFIEKLAPGVKIDLLAEKPSMLARLAATSQLVRVDIPGEQPLITDLAIEEDSRLLGDEFSYRTISTAERKRLLADADTAAEFTFYTGPVYTFDFYQSLFDARSFSMDLGFANISLVNCLGDQPVDILAKTVDGRYLWSFQIWNEAQLNQDGLELDPETQ